jgi:hypothetical protein
VADDRPDERPSTVPEAGARGTSGWVVWVALAGVLLLVVGVFHVVQALGVLLTDKRFLLRDSGFVLDISSTAWGWIHLVGGVAMVAAGFFVFGGRVWARAVGVLAALVSGLVAISLFAGSPVWALALIALDLLIVVALTIHGSEIRAGA